MPATPGLLGTFTANAALIMGVLILFGTLWSGIRKIRAYRLASRSSSAVD